MADAFIAGGWAMWFVLAFGLLAISGAGRFAFGGVASLDRFSRWMMVTTLLTAVFGFTTGMIRTASISVERATDHAARMALIVEGTGEALHNISMGLLLVTLTALLLAIGHRRHGTPDAANSPRDSLDSHTRSFR